MKAAEIFLLMRGDQPTDFNKEMHVRIYKLWRDFRREYGSGLGTDHLARLAATIYGL